MLTAGKVWGTTALLFRNETVEVHYLEILKGGFSSEHRHSIKGNLIHLLSGDLLIKTWQPKGMVDQSRLQPGDQAWVRPGIFHQFEALEDCRVVEIYHAGLAQDDDIDRRTEGGRRTIAEINFRKKKSE